MEIKNKIQITLVVFIASLAGLLFLVVLPGLAKVKQASNNLAREELYLLSFKNQLLSLKDFEDKQSTFSQQILQLKSFFVETDAPVAFVEFLEDQALLLDLQLKLIPSSSIQNDKGLIFQMNLGGDYINALRFIERLEQGPWLIELSQLAIKQIDEMDAQLKEFSQLETGDISLLITIKTIN